MEFAAFRQRWASGIEIDYDKEGNAKPPFTAGVERLWVSENPEVKFGDFDAADLEQFLKVKDSFRTDIAIITFTPLYYFKQAGANFPSGESPFAYSAWFSRGSLPLGLAPEDWAESVGALPV